MATFPIKRSDRLPVLRATLKENVGTADEAAINLTTATGVTFTMRNRATGVVKIDEAAATITDAAAGEVEYSWAAGDTDTAGEYDAEWVVTFTGGLPMTVPNDGYDLIVVTADLA